jgi:dipeptidyl aminopeptidase/acylaminoacyl peptidase
MASKFILIQLFLFSFSLLNFQIASAKQAKTINLSIDHIMKMKSVESLALSPDSKWIAYVVTRVDEEKDKKFSQIHITSIDSKTTLPMTAVYMNASDPQWSPDGKYLAFLGVRGTDKDTENQVWTLDLRGGEAVQFTNVPQGVNSYRWSPDGTKMALVIKDAKPLTNASDENSSNEKLEPFVIDRLQFKKDYVGYLDRRRTHIYIKNGHEKPIQITFGDYDDSDPQWNPDNKLIAFVSKREGDPDANNNSDIWLVDSSDDKKNRELKKLTMNPGPDTNPSWSPDGNTIAYISSIEPDKLWYATEHLAITDKNNGETKLLSLNYDRMISTPMFSNDGKSIFALASDRGNRPLIKFDLSNGDKENITPGELSVRNYAIGNRDKIITLMSSHHSPFNFYQIKRDEIINLTNYNNAILKDTKLADVKRLIVPGWRNEPVESFIYYPPNYDNQKIYPTIFVLHGGPVSQHDTSFDEFAQLYAANGYIAVLPNPHGSSGYGQAYSYALNKKWGVPDFEDVDAIADYLVENGVSDPNKLGVGGWSYGGILTNYVITKSTRFSGAVSGASEVNHRANYGHDIYQNEWEVELGLPWVNIEDWEAINPFNDLGKVTTPTLVIGGQLDWNVPILNSEQLYQVLKRRGIDTKLVVYPGEYHGINRPSFVRDRYERFIDWFDQYVK